MSFSRVYLLLIMYTRYSVILSMFAQITHCALSMMSITQIQNQITSFEN